MVTSTSTAARPDREARQIANRATSGRHQRAGRPSRQRRAAVCDQRAGERGDENGVVDLERDVGGPHLHRGVTVREPERAAVGPGTWVR